MQGPIVVKVLPKDVETLQNALLYLEYNGLCDNFVLQDLRQLIVALIAQVDKKGGLD